MVLRGIVGRSVLNLFSVYAPQSGRCSQEEFFTLLGEVVSEIDDGEKLLICGDMKGNVGAEIDGFEYVHGRQW